jgi:hypothetical protein
METMLQTEGGEGEDYRSWPLRQRLELLAFDAGLMGVLAALLAALWEAIDALQLYARARLVQLKAPIAGEWAIGAHISSTVLASTLVTEPSVPRASAPRT